MAVIKLPPLLTKLIIFAAFKSWLARCECLGILEKHWVGYCLHEDLSMVENPFLTVLRMLMYQSYMNRYELSCTLENACEYRWDFTGMVPNFSTRKDSDLKPKHSYRFCFHSYRNSIWIIRHTLVPFSMNSQISRLLEHPGYYSRAIGIKHCCWNLFLCILLSDWLVWPNASTLISSKGV